MSLKSCNIVYGYLEHCPYIFTESPDNYVLLIEPRGEIIDILKKKILNKNIILVSKMLSEKDTLTNSILYFNKEENTYFVKNDELLIRGTNYFNIKKYNVFTTSINNLIVQYNIQNINSLVININIQNCNDILDSIIPFNHIISDIVINNITTFSENCKILENFCKEEDTFTDDVDRRRGDSPVKIFSHKNLYVKLPNIGMFFNGKLKNNKEITLLIQQYKMNLIIIRKNDSYISPYPESITILNNNINDNTFSKIYHENIIQNLDCIFNKNNVQNIQNIIDDTNENTFTDGVDRRQGTFTDGVDRRQGTFTDGVDRRQGIVENIESTKELQIGDLEIIIQFNPKYFDNNKTLQIMYPLKDNVLYINKVYDIIYGTKNCIYMLYQIIKSKYFSDFLEEKKSSRPKLFTIFSKIYFFEYISKIFVVKEF